MTPEQEYFDLLMRCTDVYYASKSPIEHPLVFWRNSVRRQWTQVYQHMTKPVEGGVMHLADARRRELANNFAALSRMAAMAAWWIGTVHEGESWHTEQVAERFIEYGDTQVPKLR